MNVPKTNVTTGTPALLQERDKDVAILVLKVRN